MSGALLAALQSLGFCPDEDSLIADRFWYGVHGKGYSTSVSVTDEIAVHSFDGWELSWSATFSPDAPSSVVIATIRCAVSP